jgi:hypothetical protein
MTAVLAGAALALQSEIRPDRSTRNPALENGLAEATNEKLYKAEYVGSGTFVISKPKRKKQKQRQTRLKNVSRGSRK